MPELPEVETLRRHLEGRIIGYKIQQVHVLKKRIVRPEDAKVLERAMQGYHISGIHRRGKFLILQLCKPSRSKEVLIHLGMTGRLFSMSNSDAANRLSHLALHLKCDQGQICYVDVRTFGRWSLDLTSIDRLGPEPLDVQWFNARYMQKVFKGRKSKLKDMLMDQACVAGLGNIYVCEALHAAALHPLLPVGQIPMVDLKRLCQCIRRTLKSALKIGQESELDLQGSDGTDGFFYFGRFNQHDEKVQERFRVYDRKLEPCLVCNTPIERVVISQRSTYYCPNCQKL